MEFKTHRDADGFVPSKQVRLHGPKEPGTLVTHHSSTRPREVRLGFIVAVHHEQCDVMWQDWHHGESPGEPVVRSTHG